MQQESILQILHVEHRSRRTNSEQEYTMSSTEDQLAKWVVRIFAWKLGNRDVDRS